MIERGGAGSVETIPRNGCASSVMRNGAGRGSPISVTGWPATRGCAYPVPGARCVTTRMANADEENLVPLLSSQTYQLPSLSPLHRSLRGERETYTCWPTVLLAVVQPCARIARSRRTSHREDDGEPNINSGKKKVGAVARPPTCRASTPSRPVRRAMRDKHVRKGLNGLRDLLFNLMYRDTAHGGRKAGPSREAGPAWGLGGAAHASLDLYGQSSTEKHHRPLRYL